MSNQVTVTIPPALWMSSNRPIKNVGYKARVVRALQVLMTNAARETWLLPVAGAVNVDWTIQYPKSTGWAHGDPTNAAPTTKALLDAIVAGNWLIGDGPRVVMSETFRRGPNLLEPKLHAVTLRLSPTEET